MEYAFVAVPAGPMRKKARHASEMISQLLFGEAVKILKTKNELWVKVRSLHDNYEGWMTRTLLQEVTGETAKTKSVFVIREPLEALILANESIHVPFGSSLPFYKQGKGMMGELTYTFDGQPFRPDKQKPGLPLLTTLTSSWLNAPYLWGGRTLLGVDCSGFVQVIFKMMGFDLPRDAWQQAKEGADVLKFKDAKAGDLFFFEKDKKIMHVGIYLGNEKMIHASGKVKIDLVNKKGLVDPQCQTGMKLSRIRRIWS